VIVYGHTHRLDIHRQGKTLIINPGETGGWVTGKATVATLDPENLDVEIHQL
jgi:predicted phosphodiesterase